MDLFGIDPRLPVTASVCMRVGMAGNCDVDCPAFVDGDCEEPQEFTKESVIEFYGDNAIDILELYDCFEDKET